MSSIHLRSNSDSSLDCLVEQLRESFVERHGHPPQWVVAAPGRVNLIGEHIDYNDGFVLPMAIERYVAIAASPSLEADSQAEQAVHEPTAVARARNGSKPIAGEANRRTASFYSTNLQQQFEIDLDEPIVPSKPSWSNYIRGVLAGFAQRDARLPSIEAICQSNVPLGGGLSSSAALEVATATLCEVCTKSTLSPAEKALICQQAEHDFAGVPCGIMDQFSSVFGSEDALMLLDCQTQVIEHVPFTDEGIVVLITNSNVKHELSGGEYADRRSQCDSALSKIAAESWRDVSPADLQSARKRLLPVEYQRASHVVSEIARTREAADAIAQENWAQFGELMYQSHRSLRDAYEVSCRELDLLVEIASELGESAGVIGSRMTGGGFGGCTVTLVRRDAVADVSGEIIRQYHARTGIDPFAFSSRPARGAHVIAC